MDIWIGRGSLNLTKLKLIAINLTIFIFILALIEGVSRFVVDRGGGESLFSDEKLRVRGPPLWS